MRMRIGEQRENDGDAGACLMRRAGLEERMRRRYIGASFSYVDGGRLASFEREGERQRERAEVEIRVRRRRRRSVEELLYCGRWLGRRP